MGFIVGRDVSVLGITNVLEKGAKGDGTTDDLQKLQDCFNDNTIETVYIPDGDYLISDILYINNRCNIFMSENARIFTNSNLDFLIRYNYNSTSDSESQKAMYKRWSGGILDGNDKVKTILGMSSYGNFTMSNLLIKNFTENGLVTKDNTNRASFELNASSLRFRNDVNPTRTGTIAIYNNGRDNRFKTINMLNIETQILTYDGVFDDVHAWIDQKTLYPTSTFAQIEDTYASFINCNPDTLRYIFKINNGKFFRAINTTIVASSYVYDSSVYNSYGMVIVSGTGYGIIKDLYSNVNNGTHVVVETYNSNKFYNCKFEGTGATYTLTNYRDTSDLNYLGTINGGNISSGSPDLNNKTSFSTWQITDASFLVNAPTTTELGTLLVYTAGTGYHIVQKYIPYGKEYFYMRQKNTSTWTSWCRYNSEIDGSTTFDPNNLNAGDTQITTVTVTGAAMGDYAVASFSNDLAGLTLTAYVSATDTVTCILNNLTSGAINIASGTLRARVTKL